MWRMKMIKRLILVVLVPVVYTCGSLLAVKYPVINYHTSDGLPQNQVNTLIQDQLGYIYVGTQSGIGKFDGTKFQVLTKKNGLPNNFINDFAMDHEGNIWAATQEGLARLDKNTQITAYLTTEFIQALCCDPKTNTLWILTGTGIYSLQEGESQFVHSNLLDAKFKESKEYIPKGLIITDTGDKYVYSEEEILEIKNDRLRTIKSEKAINFIKEWDQKIVIGTKQGLFRLQGEQLIPYLNFPLESGSQQVTDMVPAEKGITWVGTQNGLLYYPSPSEPPIIITEANGLTSSGIRKILIDREKNIFIGTEWGLSQLSPNLIKMYDESDDLPHKFVWDFEEDNDSILVACNRGIVALDSKSGKITSFSINSRLTDFSIRALVKVGEKDFLLGTRRNGIFRWNRQDKLERIYQDVEVTSAVRAPWPGNIVWFGTANGLLQYDGSTQRFQLLQAGLNDRTIWTLDVYDRDTVLVGTGKGVQKCVQGKFVPSDLGTRIGKDTLVNDIKVISPSEILVATELRGLYLYQHNQLEQLTTSNGLTHNDVWSVIKDDAGNIWLNTSVSLDRYTNGFVSHFNKKSGLFGEEGAIHAMYKASNGTIYIGIIPGFIEIPVQETAADFQLNKPILYVHQLKISGKKKNIDSHQSDHLDLTYGQNNIEFDYIAVSMRKENPVFYKTRLLPLENHWSEPTRETHIKYLNLAPDNYIFQLVANNGGGEDQWFQSQNQVTLQIRKPVWLTWWFILLSLMVGLLLFFFIIKIRLNALEKQKIFLEEQVRERTEKLKYLSITDPLTDLKNRRYLEEKIKEDISLIERYVYDKSRSPQKRIDTPILGVFILDIDYFKKVNDHWGHKAGDIVIVEIARLLIDMLRHSDTIVRWGGEEFLIITWQKEKSNSFELAERIRKKIEAYEFKVDENTTLRKTVSVGFAHFPFFPDEVERVKWPHVVSLADSGLYIAKNNGRNLSVGIQCSERALEADSNFKDIVANIKIGVRKKYLEIISTKSNLVISQHKAET
jgi:diguanylate cyclase (GGDEF)-like protein